MKTLFTFIACLLLITTNAQLNLQWQSLGPDNLGGNVKGLVIDNRDNTGHTLYMGVYGSGIWKSINAGVSWTYLGCLENNAISCMTQSPDGVIYYGTGVFPLTYATANANYSSAYYSSAYYSESYRGNGLFKIDNADQITHVTSTTVNNINSSVWTTVFSIAVNPVNASQILVGTFKGLFISRDTGSTWNEIIVQGIGAGRPSNTVKWGITGNIIYANMNDANKLVVSKDAGLTWERIGQFTNTGFPSSQGDIAIGIATNNDSVVYTSIATIGGGFFGVFYSKNAGETWDTLSMQSNYFDLFPHASGYANNTIAVIPGTTDSIVVAGECMYTADVVNGIHSRVPFSNIDVLYNDNIRQITELVYSNVNPDELYIITSNGLFKSNNAVSQFNNPTVSFNSIGLSIAPLHSIAASLNGENIIGEASFLGVIKNKNVGKQFEAVLGRSTGASGALCEYSRIDTSCMFASLFYSEIDRSYDNASTWSTFFDTIISPDGSDYACYDTSGIPSPFRSMFWLFETEQAWNTIDSAWYNAASNLLQGDDIIVQSNIAGHSFHYTLPYNINAGQTMHIPDPVKSRLISVTKCGLFITNNALSNNPKWFLLSGNRSASSVTSAAESNNCNIFYTGNLDGCIYKYDGLNFINYDSIYGTRDSVATYTRIVVEPNKRIEGLAISSTNSNRIICALPDYDAMHNVYLSNDGGVTWSGMNVGGMGNPAYTCVFDKFDADKIIVGTEKGMWISINGGLTWNQDNTFCNTAVTKLRQIPFNEYGCPVLYAAVNGGGLYRSFTLTPAGCATISDIKNIEDNNGSTLHLYPNPTSGYLNVEINAKDGKPVAISVYDITGRLLHAETHTVIQSAFSINVSGLPKGMYLLSAKSDNYHHTAKFTVE